MSLWSSQLPTTLLTMPPPKHPLSPIDTNVQHSSQKSQKLLGKENAPVSEEGQTAENQDEHPMNDRRMGKQALEYVRIPRPYFDFEKENSEKTGDERIRKDQLSVKYQEYLDNQDNLLQTIAADAMEEKWISLWKTWTMSCEWNHASNPPDFGTTFLSTSYPCDTQELVEDMLTEFNKEVSKKDKDDESIKQMWAIIAALPHWLLDEQLSIWMMSEDGSHWALTVNLIGTAFLEALNELDRTSNLSPTSPLIRDLSLVTSLYLQLGLEFDDADDDADWRKDVLMYVKKAGMDVVKDGCFGMQATMDKYQEMYGDVKVSKSKPKFNRFGWKKTFKDFNDRYQNEEINMFKTWTQGRAQRSSLGIPPMSDISDMDLERGYPTNQYLW